MSVDATADPRSPDTPVEALETELTVLARRLEHAARRSDPSTRLDRAGYLLCRTLERLDSASVNELAQALALDGSTVTRQVAALAERGFVARRSDPDDRRAVLLSLTADGRREMADVRARRLDRLGASLDDWSAGDVASFADLLGRFNRALERFAADTPTER